MGKVPGFDSRPIYFFLLFYRSPGGLLRVLSFHFAFSVFFFFSILLLSFILIFLPLLSFVLKLLVVFDYFGDTALVSLRVSLRQNAFQFSTCFHNVRYRISSRFQNFCLKLPQYRELVRAYRMGGGFSASWTSTPPCKEGERDCALQCSLPIQRPAAAYCGLWTGRASSPSWKYPVLVWGRPNSFEVSCTLVYQPQFSSGVVQWALVAESVLRGAETCWNDLEYTEIAGERLPTALFRPSGEYWARLLRTSLSVI